MLGRVMPFKPLDETTRFGGGEGRVERRGRVGAEIVLHQHDLGRVGEMRVGQILERLGVIDGRVTVGDFHVPPAFQRREHHEQIGHAVAFVFVVVPRRFSRFDRDGRARFDDQLDVYKRQAPSSTARPNDLRQIRSSPYRPAARSGRLPRPDT